MILFLLFQTCTSSGLFDYSSNNNITSLFHGCNLAGENKANYLFQCLEMNVIIPKLELQKEDVYTYSFNSSEKVQLSNYLLSELKKDEETQSYQLQLSLLYYSGYGEQLDPIRSKQDASYQFYDYQISVVDGILNVIGFLISYSQSNYASLYLLQFYPGKINDHYPNIFNLTCENVCNIIDYQQQYIQQRNCILIIILEQNLVSIFELSLFDSQLRTVSQHFVGNNEADNKIVSAKLIGQYYLVTFQTYQTLYHISSVLFELKFIQKLSIDPIVINEKYGYLFQKANQQTKFFLISKQKPWFENMRLLLVEDLNIQFSQSIIVLNEKQFIFVHDNFKIKLLEIDLKITEEDFEQDCHYNYASLPEINENSLHYQQDYILDKKLIFTKNENKSVSELKEMNQCEIPCDTLYQEFDTQLIPYEQQCIVKSLEALFTNHCSLYLDCFSCMYSFGCSWIQNKCEFEKELYEVDISSNFQSSKWYIGKELMCEEKNEDLMNNFCSYNQTLFEKEKYLKFTGQIEKGHICSWFFDSNELQQFILKTETDFLQTPAKIQPLLCIGETKNGICKEANIGAWNQKEQSYLFYGYYFRFSLIFLEDSLANNIILRVYNSTPVTFMEKIKQSIIQMIAWLLCGLFFFFLMGYIAKRRLQYLIAQTMDIELNYIQNPNLRHNQALPLSNQVLENVMQGLKDQEIITNHSSESSIYLYGEDSCAFCFDKYDSQQRITQLFCGHVFHLECFENWIRIKGTLEKCPVCNQKVDHYLANKEEFAQIKSQIQERINEQDQNTTNLIE